MSTLPNSTVDVLVVGGGFAGLSAALTLLRQKHSVILYDSGSFRDRYSSRIHTLPTWDARNPQDYRDAARRELLTYPHFQLRNTEVTTLARRDPSDGFAFAATDTSGTTAHGRKLVLATGVQDVLNLLPGFESAWGKSMSVFSPPPATHTDNLAFTASSATATTSLLPRL